jgi:hypothetical protein
MHIPESRTASSLFEALAAPHTGPYRVPVGLVGEERHGDYFSDTADRHAPPRSDNHDRQRDILNAYEKPSKIYSDGAVFSPRANMRGRAEAICTASISSTT